MSDSIKRRFVVCVDNEGYEASLELRKIYQSISDVHAKDLTQVRVIDESGNSYLYPKSFFQLIRLRTELSKKLFDC